MYSCELRFVSMLLINILKSLVDDGIWDAFGILNTWTKFSTIWAVLVLFSFYSIRISQARILQVRFHSFSVVVFVSFLSCLILPQCVCWPYFLVAWLSTYPSFSLVVTGVLHCLEGVLSRNPGYDITIDLEMGEGERERAAWMGDDT